MTIPIGIKGRIRNSEVQEPYLIVQDDLSNTGGYLILQSDTPDFITGHDSWVSKNDLEGFFSESGWKIEWPESNDNVSVMPHETAF